MSQWRMHMQNPGFSDVLRNSVWSKVEASGLFPVVFSWIQWLSWTPMRGIESLSHKGCWKVCSAVFSFLHQYSAPPHNCIHTTPISGRRCRGNRYRECRDLPSATQLARAGPGHQTWGQLKPSTLLCCCFFFAFCKKVCFVLIPIFWICY